MQDSSGAPSDTAQEMKDKIFLRKVTEDGLAQVQMGKLASERASSQDVKDFGQKMVDEHAKLNDSMAAIADSIGMRLPKNLNKSDQAQYQKLSTLSGDAFDKEYLACMVRDHHENMREFRVESQTTTDPDLKAAVEKGEKIVREHLILASKLAVQNGVPIPTHGSKPVAAQPN
jgi:putative membrane protein